MNAVFGAILENLSFIKIIFEPTVSIFTGDRKNTGDCKELTVAEFVSRFFLNHIKLKKQKYMINIKNPTKLIV